MSFEKSEMKALAAALEPTPKGDVKVVPFRARERRTSDSGIHPV